MAQALDAVWLPVLPSMKGFGPALVKGAGAEADKSGKSVGQRFGTAIVAGTAVVGAGVGAAATALYKVGEVFDDVADTIRTGTGATGAALDGLVASAKNVGAKVPAEFSQIGAVVSDVSTRMGLTGETLETVASQYLEAGRILGQEVDVSKTSAAFNAFQIEGDQVSGALDHLFQVSQATGIGMNELADAAAKNAPAMQTLGFSFEETTAMVGSFDKAGLNSSAIMASMSKGLVTLAKDGEQPAEAFRRVQGELGQFIAKGDEAGALNLASKVFGTRGATQFIGALKDGALNLEDMSRAAGQTEDSILGVGGETMDFAEQWMMFKNKVLVWLEPMGARVFGALGTIMGEVSGGVTAFGAAFSDAGTDVTSSGLAGFLETVGLALGGIWGILSQGDFNGKLVGAFGWEEDHPMVDFLFNVRDLFIEVTGGINAFGAAWVANDGDITSSGFPGFMEALAYQLRQAFDYVQLTVLPALAQFVKFLVDNQVILVTLAAAVGGYAAAMGTLSIISTVRGWIAAASAAQWGLNAAMSANPIGLIIAGIAALVAGLIWFFTQTDLGKQIVANAWAWIQSAVNSVVGWFQNTALPIIQGVFAAVGSVFTWLYENIIKPVWDGITSAINTASIIITAIFQLIHSVIHNVLAPVFRWFYATVVKPVFDAIGAAIAWVWDNTVKRIFDAWVWIFQNVLGPAFTWLYETVIKPAFDGIGSAISWVWENVLKPVFDALNKFITETIPGAFEKGVGFIKTAWDKLQEIAKAPVRFVVDTVINDGLIGAFNTVAGILPGIDKLPRVALPSGFADGGYTGDGGKYEPKGVVHGGEFVLTKEQTRRAGVRNLYALAKSLSGYAKGGLVNPLRNAVVSSGFGMRPGGFHNGMDFAAAEGTPVGAAGPGRVSSVGWSQGGGGNEVHIDHPNGLQTWYSHLLSFGVKLGQMVNAGSLIGKVGSTGNSTGPHLHYMVLNGGWPNYVNPADYLNGGGQAGTGGWNPIGGIIDGLLAQFKAAFPAAGMLADIAIGIGKKLLTGASDSIMGNAGRDNIGSTGLPYLHDQGGVLNPGLTAVMNRTRKPEAILNAQQWADIHQLATVRGGVVGGGGDVHVHGNVGWMPEQLAQEIEVHKRREQTMAGMSGVVFA